MRRAVAFERVRWLSIGFRFVRLPSTPVATDGGSDARDAGHTDEDADGG